MNIADELFTREVLDGEQVRRMVRGLSLDEPPPAATTGPATAHPAHSSERRAARSGRTRRCRRRDTPIVRANGLYRAPVAPNIVDAAIDALDSVLRRPPTSSLRGPDDP